MSPWTDAELAPYLAPHTIHWWGYERAVTPSLCAKVFGDGLQLLALQPLDTRPHYYVIRIDSAWALDGEEGDEFRAHLDEIKDALCEQFGDDGHECFTEEDPAEWPVCHLESGCHWWRLAFHPSTGREP